ncbi:MAG TPA: DMT family transporter [Acidobacteriota bacterium]|nr:DMT family transporter [Acidobacteriota bacterium]
MNPSFLRLTLTLAAGVVAIAFGSIFVRFSQEAPSLTIAFYRMAWAALLMLPFYGWRRLRKGWTILEPWTPLAGIILALHFAFWIASLKYTTVAVSVLLVNTAPVVVAAVSHFGLREKMAWPGWLGLGLSFCGSAWLVWSDLRLLGSWKGALLALAGAWMLGLYLLIGGMVRRRRSLIEYVYPVYFIAALTLLVLAVAWGGKLTGFSWSTHGSLLLLGLVPQCIGHSSYNWALRYLSAVLISALVLAEPLLATLLAWWLLSEAVAPTVVPGGALVLSGILLVTVQQTRIRGEREAPA